MAEKYDKVWAPHRHLHTGDRGLDAMRLQVALNKRRKVRNLPAIGQDGEVGPETISAFHDMAYRIGLNHRKLTAGNQALMRWPWKRDKSMKAKAEKRKNEQPLRLRAYAVAKTLVGVMEQGGNNMGPMVTKIIRENGGGGPEPWCGDTMAFCYRHAGSKAVQRAWAAVRYLGFITGMSITHSPQTGDIVCFTFDHTGMFVKDLGNGYILTIEGNTGPSGAVSDSSTGGDGVYLKRRSKSLVARYVRVTR